MKYDECKQNLAKKFSDDNRRYTEGNKKLIAELIEEAKMWKKNMPEIAFRISGTFCFFNFF